MHTYFLSLSLSLSLSLCKVGDRAKNRRAQMKRSPATSSSSPSSSSSISSSGSDRNPRLEQKPKRERARRARSGGEPPKGDKHGSCGRSSTYRGVTKHRWTQRFEAHLWDKASWNSSGSRRGRQVYLGAYASEEAAARTYDLAALKYYGPHAVLLNFPIGVYEEQLKEMWGLSRDEYPASLRRRSNGFSRGVSKYRGVAKIYLFIRKMGITIMDDGRLVLEEYMATSTSTWAPTYGTREEAAEAYDMAAIQYRGANAVTNFGVGIYVDRLRKKGIRIDRFGSDQPPRPLPDPKSEDNDEEQDARNGSRSPAAELQQQPQPPRTEASAAAGDGELPGSFCADTGFPQLPIPYLPDLFDEINGFEDDIDLVFNPESGEEIFRGGASMETSDSSSGADDVDVPGRSDGSAGVPEKLLSSSSPPPSTTTAHSPSASTATAVSCFFCA